MEKLAALLAVIGILVGYVAALLIIDSRNR